MTGLVDILAEAPSTSSRYVDAVLPLWCGEHELTPAERAVVRCGASGLVTHEAIAAELGVATSTVKKQISHICKKVGVASFRDVVVSLLRAALDAVPSAETGCP